MPKTRSRATFDRNDPYRALLTDTSTTDVPIIFSNDGLRANLLRQDEMSAHEASIVEGVLKVDHEFTIPYRYRIPHKSEGGFRQLALPHPRSQLRAAELYQEYAELITYYCTKSNFSLRHPVKVASSFYFKNPLADLNKYRDSGVLMERSEKLFAHPSSYFAYSGSLDRYYKYFQSDEFYSMEKKYPFMLKTDVAKCFASIYTHTVSWAIKDVDHGKLNTRSLSLGNELDRAMQRMNYNETNGILIGPEFSRIFAEIILQATDRMIELELAKENLKSGRDYDIRRYIDDYLVFAATPSSLVRIKLAIGENLAKFNLYLNESKTETFSRPFQTIQSAVVDAAVSVLEHFWSQNTHIVDKDELRYSVANKVGDHGKLAKSLLRLIKTICHENGADYGAVAPVLVSAIDIRIQRLVDSFDKHAVPDVSKRDQLLIMMALLEVSYFLYSVKPSVSSSYRIGRSTILAVRFCEQNLPEFKPVLCEHIIRQSQSFFEASSASRSDGKLSQIDSLNLLIALTELPAEYFSRLDHIVAKLASGARDYFEIITVLFCAGRCNLMVKHRGAIEQRVQELIDKGLKPKLDAQDCYLMFDLVSCPYLSVTIRGQIVAMSRKALGLSNLTRVELEALVSEFQAHPWFVRWGRIDLLREMTKRELNEVY